MFPSSLFTSPFTWEQFYQNAALYYHHLMIWIATLLPLWQN